MMVDADTWGISELSNDALSTAAAVTGMGISTRRSAGPLAGASGLVSLSAPAARSHRLLLSNNSTAPHKCGKARYLPRCTTAHPPASLGIRMASLWTRREKVAREA